MAVAPAAAEIPVLAFMVIGLLGFLGWGICVGLRGVWVNTLGLMLLTLADLLKYDKAFIHIDFGGPVRALNTTVLNALLHTGQKFQHSAGYFFHGAAVIQGWAARELMGLAHDVLGWSDWLQHAHLPRFVKAMIYAALPPLLIVRLVKAAIAAELPHLGRVITVKWKIDRALLKRLAVGAVTAAIGATLPGLLIPGRLRKLEHDMTTAWRRLRSLEKYAAAGGAVALFTAAIAKLGLKWIRCKNVTRAGRAVCRTDASWLESLLGDALVIASVISVVEFAKGLQSIEDEAVKILSAGIREFPG